MKPKKCPFCYKEPERRYDGIKGWSIFHTDDCFIKILAGRRGIRWTSDFYEAYPEDISLWNMRGKRL